MTPQYLIKRFYLYGERFILKQNKVITNPALIKINTGYICNLRCPLCPTGFSKKRIAEELTIEKLKFILSRTGLNYKISLFGWGESFLNPDIFKMIKYLKSKNCYIYIDSNLNFSKEITKRIEEISFDFLSVSLDGVDQESYSQYRYNGNFELAFSNLKQLHTSKMGPKKIEWQYIVNKKNAKNIQKASEIAKELNIPIRFMDIGLYIYIYYDHTQDCKNEWWTEDQKKNEEISNSHASSGTCYYMYNDPFIDTDGKVYPCCNAVYAPDSYLKQGFQNVFGNLHDQSLSEIWNNELYQYMRSKFSNRPYKGKKCKPICLKCRVYLLSKNIIPENRPVFCFAE